MQGKIPMRQIRRTPTTERNLTKKSFLEAVQGCDQAKNLKSLHLTVSAS